jgi:hypothetical protein
MSDVRAPLLEGDLDRVPHSDSSNNRTNNNAVPFWFKESCIVCVLVVSEVITMLIRYDTPPYHTNFHEKDNYSPVNSKGIALGIQAGFNVFLLFLYVYILCAKTARSETLDCPLPKLIKMIILFLILLAIHFTAPNLYEAFCRVCIDGSFYAIMFIMWICVFPQLRPAECIKSRRFAAICCVLFALFVVVMDLTLGMGASTVSAIYFTVENVLNYDAAFILIEYLISPTGSHNLSLTDAPPANSTISANFEAECMHVVIFLILVLSEVCTILVRINDPEPFLDGEYNIGQLTETHHGRALLWQAGINLALSVFILILRSFRYGDPTEYNMKNKNLSENSAYIMMTVMVFSLFLMIKKQSVIKLTLCIINGCGYFVFFTTLSVNFYAKDAISYAEYFCRCHLMVYTFVIFAGLVLYIDSKNELTNHDPASLAFFVTEDILVCHLLEIVYAMSQKAADAKPFVPSSSQQSSDTTDSLAQSEEIKTEA